MASLSLKNIYKIYPNGFNAVKDFNMEIEDFDLVMRDDPERPGVVNAVKVPMLLVPVVPAKNKEGDEE